MNDFLKDIIKLHEKLNEAANLNNVLKCIYDSFSDYLEYRFISISLIDTKGIIYTNEVIKDSKINLSQEYIDDFLARTVKNIYEKKDSLVFCNENNLISGIAYPLVSNNNIIGAITFVNMCSNTYNVHQINCVKLIAQSIAAVVYKNAILDDLLLSVVTGLTRMVEAKDIDTGMHISRIQQYSKIIAQDLLETGEYQELLDEQYIEDLYKFSPLHDIGKVGIADKILLKPGKLSVSEYEEIKNHTIIGASVLREASNNLMMHGKNYFEMAIQIAESHHEKYDGSGYPYGLNGDDIPLCARIVAVADVFDVLTSKRVYKDKYSLAYSFQQITEGSGKHFDPRVVQAFINSGYKIISVYEKYQYNIAKTSPVTQEKYQSVI